jgi:hypothetical protein
MKKLLFAWLGMQTACVSVEDNATKLEKYRLALSAAEKKAPTAIDAKVREEAVKRLAFFYEDFSSKRVREHLAEVYAPDAYFRDNVREVTGLKAMEQYFAHSVKDIYFCGFRFEDTAHQGPHLYLRWVMQLQKDKNSERLQYVGMSHIILNQEGQVLFQQDYWDFSELLEEAPLLGSIIAWIKSRLAG